MFVEERDPLVARGTPECTKQQVWVNKDGGYATGEKGAGIPLVSVLTHPFKALSTLTILSESRSSVPRRLVLHMTKVTAASVPQLS